MTRGDLMKAGAGGSPGLVKEVALVRTCPVCTAAQHRDRENDLPASRGGSLEVDNIIYYKRQCASSRNLLFRAWCFMMQDKKFIEYGLESSAMYRKSYI